MAYLNFNYKAKKMKTAKEITKRSTLLATIRSEFPKSTAIDLENELFEMINKALIIGAVVGQSEQYHCELYDFGRKDKPCYKQCDGCKAMNLD